MDIQALHLNLTSFRASNFLLRSKWMVPLLPHGRVVCLGIDIQPFMLSRLGCGIMTDLLSLPEDGPILFRSYRTNYVYRMCGRLRTQAIILVCWYEKRPTCASPLDRCLPSQLSRSHCVFLRPTTPSNPGISEISYADASEAKDAGLADELLQRLCSLALVTRQSG